MEARNGALTISRAAGSALGLHSSSRVGIVKVLVSMVNVQASDAVQDCLPASFFGNNSSHNQSFRSTDSTLHIECSVCSGSAVELNILGYSVKCLQT